MGVKFRAHVVLVVSQNTKRSTNPKTFGQAMNVFKMYDGFDSRAHCLRESTL